MYDNKTDQISFDVSAAQEAESNVQRVAAQLSALLAGRNTDVNAAMSEFTATGISDNYQTIEGRWGKAGLQTEEIVTTITQLLKENGVTATDGMSQAQNCLSPLM